MTRRKGVIAALAALAATMKGQTTRPTGLVWEMQKGPTKDIYSLRGCHANSPNSSDGGISTVSCDYPEVPEPEFALTVVYGDKTVKLTAKEIMDALEGK
jgi:hypothetical protein